MAVTPSGILSTPLTVLQAMLSEVVAFQTWTSTVDAPGALARIALVGIKKADVTYPLAVVMPGSWGRRMNAGGGRNHFTSQGVLQLKFKANIATANQADPADAYFEFTNNLGPIIEGLELLSGATLADGTGGLFVTAYESEANAMRSSDAEKAADGDQYDMIFDIEWGIE